MIVSESDALSRLGSPLNLMNRMRAAGSSRRDAMGLFGINQKQAAEPAQTSTPVNNFNPFPAKSETALTVRPASTDSRPAVPIAPTIPAEEDTKSELDKLLDNADSTIKLGLAHNKALETLTAAIDETKLHIAEIKPEKLPAVITAMSKVVSDIQRQRIENKKSNVDNRSVHFHYYTQTQKKVEDYDVIEVG